MASSVNAVAGLALDGVQIAAADHRVNHDLTGDATAIDARAGVLWAKGNPGQVSALGTPTRQVQVAAFRGVIKSTVVDGGAYRVVLPTLVTLDVATFHATLARIDLVIAEVDDVGTSSTTRVVRVLTGTPNASPVEPVPASSTSHYLVLARINVPSAAARPSGVIQTSDIVDRRAYTAAAGGVVLVSGALANPALASGLPTATPIWDAAAGRWVYKTASSVQRMAPEAITPGGVLRGTAPADPRELRIVTGHGVPTTNSTGVAEVSTGFTQCLMFASAAGIDPANLIGVVHFDFGYGSSVDTIGFKVWRRDTPNATLNSTNARLNWMAVGC